MTNLQQTLGLHAFLAAADESLPSWGLIHPVLGPIRSLQEVVLGSRTGSHADRDLMLLGLARRASQLGGDDREAAAVLCHLLIPGVIAKLGRMRLPITSDEVDALAAQHLWIQCRSFPCESPPKVAPTIVWNVRRAVLTDVGWEGCRYDRTWSSTRVVDHVLLETLPDEYEVRAEAGDELADLLTRAKASQIITGDEERLLITLVAAAGASSAKRATTHGLLSAEVSQRVAQELGVGASTVRRRVGRTLNALREAAHAAS